MSSGWFFGRVEPDRPFCEGTAPMPRAHAQLLSLSLMVAVLVLSAAPRTALADEDSRAGSSYFGIGFGYGFENFDRNDASNVDDAAGVDIWLGYRITDFWATETQVELAGFDGDGDYIAATVNAKLFPFVRLLPSRIEPFVFFGAGAGWIQVDLGSNSDIEEVAFLVRAGGGLDFYVLDNLALQISTSYVQPTQDLNNFSYVSTVAGLQYRF